MMTISNNQSRDQIRFRVLQAEAHNLEITRASAKELTNILLPQVRLSAQNYSPEATQEALENVRLQLRKESNDKKADTSNIRYS